MGCHDFQANLKLGLYFLSVGLKVVYYHAIG